MHAEWNDCGWDDEALKINGGGPILVITFSQETQEEHEKTSLHLPLNRESDLRHLEYEAGVLTFCPYTGTVKPAPYSPELA
jgi:hypothetical protein